MYSKNRKKGNFAEEIIVSHLKSNGFNIIDQNYLKKWGEIDIVAKKYGKVYFFEVKSSCLGSVSRETVSNLWQIKQFNDNKDVSRETDGIYNPVWNMTNKKKMRLSRVIRTYLADKYHEMLPEFQVDLIAILLDFSKKTAYINRIEHILLEN